MFNSLWKGGRLLRVVDRFPGISGDTARRDAARREVHGTSAAASIANSDNQSKAGSGDLPAAAKPRPLLVVGLGNATSVLSGTRHNFGRDLIEYILRKGLPGRQQQQQQQQLTHKQHQQAQQQHQQPTWWPMRYDRESGCHVSQCVTFAARVRQVGSQQEQSAQQQQQQQQQPKSGDAATAETAVTSAASVAVVGGKPSGGGGGSQLAEKAAKREYAQVPQEVYFAVPDTYMNICGKVSECSE